jgi:hypothetical protein
MLRFNDILARIAAIAIHSPRLVFGKPQGVVNTDHTGAGAARSENFVEAVDASIQLFLGKPSLGEAGTFSLFTTLIQRQGFDGRRLGGDGCHCELASLARFNLPFQFKILVIWRLWRSTPASKSARPWPAARRADWI